MPRVSRAETQKNRAAIERASARLIRERGLGVSVAEVMGAVGLTHGGFYGHFQSKDELTAIACAVAFAEGESRWKQRVARADSPEAGRAAVIEGYLASRNRAAAHCPLSSLATDVAREDDGKPVREAFSAGLERLVAVLASVQPDDDAQDARRAKALVQMSTMVGALVLARATQGRPVSDEFLDAARAHLLPP